MKYSAEKYKLRRLKWFKKKLEKLIEMVFLIRYQIMNGSFLLKFLILTSQAIKLYYENVNINK